MTGPGRERRDVREMSALELLDYLNPDGVLGVRLALRPDRATIKYFADRGLYDLTWMEANQALRGKLDAVPAELRTPDKLALVAKTGTAAAARDPERLAAWAEFADAVVRADSFADPEVLLEALQDAGRSPAEAMELVAAFCDVLGDPGRRSKRWKVTVEMFGFASDITGAAFRELADTPLANDYNCEHTIAQYREMGFTVEQMVSLSRAGLTPRHIKYGLAIAADLQGWADLPALRVDWLSPDRPLRDLVKLQESGWDDHIFGPLDLLAQLAEAGITSREQALSWDAAFRGDTRMPHEGSPLGRAREFVRLAAAGVRKSALGEYRLCGAREPEDFIRIAASGLSVTRCSELRKRHGQPYGSHNVQVFPSVDRLFAAADRESRG